MPRNFPRRSAKGVFQQNRLLAAIGSKLCAAGELSAHDRSTEGNPAGGPKQRVPGGPRSYVSYRSLGQFAVKTATCLKR